MSKVNFLFKREPNIFLGVQTITSIAPRSIRNTVWIGNDNLELNYFDFTAQKMKKFKLELFL
jgi:cytochrome b involved in lipid metabolism